MNPYGNAAQAASIPSEGNPRETEVWALSEAARRMAAASRGKPDDMRAALRLNWRLWTIFQADLTVEAEGGNVTETVVNMLSLCQFVDFHTVKALSDPTADKLEVLININRQIAGGLRDSLVNQPGPQPEGRQPGAEIPAHVAAPGPISAIA